MLCLIRTIKAITILFLFVFSTTAFCARCFDLLSEISERNRVGKFTGRFFPGEIGLRQFVDQIYNLTPLRKEFAKGFVIKLNKSLRKGTIRPSDVERLLNNGKLKGLKKYYAENGLIEFRMVELAEVFASKDKLLASLAKTKIPYEQRTQFARTLDQINFRYDKMTFVKGFSQISRKAHEFAKNADIESFDKLTEFLKHLSYQGERDFLYGLDQIDRVFIKQRRDRISLDVVSTFKRIDQKITKKREKMLAQVRLAKPTLSPHQSLQRVNRILAEERTLHYMCKTQKPNHARYYGRKAFVGFSAGAGTVLAGGGYAVNNWYEEDIYGNRQSAEKDLRWWGNLGYETAVIGLLYASQSFVFSSSGDTFMSKSWNAYWVDTIQSDAMYPVYPILFQLRESEKQKFIHDYVSQDKDLLAEIQDLIKALKGKGIDKKLKPLSDWLMSQDPEVFDPNNIANDEIIRDTLIEAMATRLYWAEKSLMDKTGSVAADRMVFNHLWMAQAVPRNILFSYWQYNALCLGRNRPIRAWLTALGLFTLDHIIFDPLYFTARDKLYGKSKLGPISIEEYDHKFGLEK